MIESVTGLQKPSENKEVYCSPVASSQTKNVCGTCGMEFTRQGNLRDHEENQHTYQNTPEAVAKRLKRTTRSNTLRRERRANDPIYKEKQRQISRTNRMNKKAKDVIPVEAEAAKEDEAEKKADSVRDGDRVGGADERVKKAHKKDKTTGVLRVETTALTTANVTSFFAPTYSAPRSKEQRTANPRPSVI
jgi:uncharacterized C2H2 Zn-finger protein